MPARNAGAADARLVFAGRVAESLEGYSAAVLTPEKRDTLQRLALALGLRPFDASLIIAIVQDSVRCGLDPLSHAAAERLAMVGQAGPAKPSTSSWSPVTVISWAAMLGILGATALIRWVGG